MTDATTITFGSNRVLITPVSLDREKANGICFQRLPENNDSVGTYYSTGDFTSPDLDTLVNFEFLNVESIDVLILKLRELRESFGEPWIAGEFVEHPDAVPLPEVDSTT